MTKNELEIIESEIMNDKKYFDTCGRVRDSYLFGKICLLLGAICLCNYPTIVEGIDFICPCCEAPIEMRAIMVEKARLFPDTWKCSQCGYDNYEGLNYCGICGGKK